MKNLKKKICSSSLYFLPYNKNYQHNGNEHVWKGCSKHFGMITDLLLTAKPRWEVPSMSSLYAGGDWGTENLKNLSGLTRLVQDGARMRFRQLMSQTEYRRLFKIKKGPISSSFCFWQLTQLRKIRVPVFLSKKNGPFCLSDTRTQWFPSAVLLISSVSLGTL